MNKEKLCTIVGVVALICLLSLFTTLVFAQTTLQVATTALANGVAGTAYSQTLSATGGTTPYVWSIQAGSTLTPGLSLSTVGVLSGTPTTAGTYNFVVVVKDNATHSATKTLAMTVATALSITTTTLPTDLVGTPYPTTNLSVTGGTGLDSWSIQSGSVPPGLTLSTAGSLSGTPSAASTYNVSIEVSDSGSPPQTATKQFAITITAPAIAISPSTLPNGLVGTAYPTTALSTTGTASYSWSLQAGSLPPGLTLSTTGTVSGTPTTAGAFDFTIQASSTSPPQTGSQAFHVVISSALTITTAASLPDAPLGAPYSATLQASGGVPPLTWTSSARLPTGLTLSSAGVLSGTPTGLGAFSFAVQVVDSSTPQQQATQTFSLNVASALAITTTSLPNALQNSAYSQQFQNVGGTAPFTWLVTKGTLPAGLMLTTGGLLQGTPTQVDTENITVTVTDSRGVVATAAFTVVVAPPISTLSAPSLPTSTTATQQLPLSMALASPHPSALTGELTLTFTSMAEVPADDPMTQFSNGSRTVNFTIPANSTNAVFSPPVMLLIGTVAGTVNLTANIDNGPSGLPVATVNVPAAPPQVTNLNVQSTAQGVDLIITGYSTPRRVTEIDFAFVVKNGSQTQTISLSENVDSQFAGWYQNPSSAAFGSAFSFTQSVTIQNGTIQTVTVTLKNAQGSGSSAAVAPQ